MNRTLVALIIAIIAFAPKTGACAPIGQGAFSGAAKIVTFEGLLPGNSITNQFAGDGVLFSGGLYVDPFPNSTIQGNVEATNFLNSATITNPIVASFPTPVFRIGFLVAGVSSPDSIRLSVFRNSVEVEALELITGATIAGGSLPSVFIGVEQPLGIDRIEISNPPGNGPFSIDDFRFESVPEPSSLALFCMTCMAMRLTCRCLSAARPGFETGALR